jgi:holo-[acyl-carrier protein] synthase
MMIVGTGIDTVRISEVQRLLDLSRAFQTHTFSEYEQTTADASANPAQSYAGFFAVKEAVFKAIGHRIKDGGFDFRKVCTRHHSDGAPYVEMTAELKALMREAGVGSILISITNEGDWATAIAIAQQEFLTES